jgi:stringent starvation protein B
MSDRSTKPYLLRALHEWATDCGYTPHIVVQVNEQCQVPMAFVKDNQITLNIGQLATGHLVIGNEYIEFQARFGGKAHTISVPVGAVTAIYARETGAGMGFELEPSASEPQPDPLQPDEPASLPGDSTDAPKRPSLKIVK